MTRLEDWPALASDGRSLAALDGRALVYERGVWGKAHGARSDYRWLARSQGLDPHLTSQLRLGTEDQPLRTVFWRALSDDSSPTYCAGVLYPSQASDATGRRGFVEKQILAWHPTQAHDTPPVPPALAALLLLPEVAGWDDGVWWGRTDPESWEDPAFVLPLSSTHLVPKIVDLDKARRSVTRGREALRDRLREDNLAHLYHRILKGPPPSFLRCPLEEPLPSEALAALLLPLPRERADRLSLVGWLPSSRYDARELGESWNVIAGEPLGGSKESVTPDATPDERASRMARTLLREGLARSVDWAERKTPPDEEPADPDETMQLASELDAPPRSQEPDPGGTRGIGAWLYPGMSVELTPPPPECAGNGLVSELHGFARSVDRRWVEPDQIYRTFPPCRDPAAAGILRRWAQELLERRPQHVHPNQWERKAELLRAAAMLIERESQDPLPEELQGPVRSWGQSCQILRGSGLGRL